ncbi:MAG: hypothetical protein JSS66_10465 [Armatimonadetes bacterium]|nr:hypothetical protein [Armatimonadota bacterium]
MGRSAMSPACGVKNGGGSYMKKMTLVMMALSLLGILMVGCSQSTDSGAAGTAGTAGADAGKTGDAAKGGENK